MDLVPVLTGPLWPLIGIAAITAAILLASAQPGLAPLFRWLPVPLWCYLLPMLAGAVGWLPQHHVAYPVLITHLLPLALGLLLLGLDLRAVARAGGRALVAAAIGALGVLVGGVAGLGLLARQLPPEAWRGVGALVGTWTGGTMNLLALRTLLNTPEPMFAPLVVVDAVVAYAWMALLMAASNAQPPIDRWLRAEPFAARPAPASAAPDDTSRPDGPSLAWCAALAFGLSVVSRLIAARLPASPLVNSATGWAILLVTTGALGLSLLPVVRRAGRHGPFIGTPCLYLVLAATGAQAKLAAFWSTPAWLLLGLVIVVTHAAALILAGRLLRLPLGVLATASQANLGGVVSAPLVGAVYHPALAPIGLVLALAGNALGTYLGLFAATWCQTLSPL